MRYPAVLFAVLSVSACSPASQPAPPARLAKAMAAPAPPPPAPPAAPEVDRSLLDPVWQKAQAVGVGVLSAEPRLVSVTPPPGGGTVCGFAPGKPPDVVVVVERRTPGLQLAVKSKGRLVVSATRYVRDAGGLGADACVAGSFPELGGGFGEPGVYGLSVLDADREEHLPFTLLVFKEGARDPLGKLDLAGSSGRPLGLAERALPARYPFLVEEDLRDPAVVKKLLASSPAELRVFAKADVARAGVRKGEPLLWSGRFAVRAGGEVVPLAEDALSLTP